jgi:hypothetical protein
VGFLRELRKSQRGRRTFNLVWGFFSSLLISEDAEEAEDAEVY